VNANPENFLHWVTLILCVVGFHGLFFYRNLALKAASWCLFQIGLMVFLYQWVSFGGPLPAALIFQLAGVTLATALLLGGLCLKLWRRYKTLDGSEIARKVSK
jgi:multisubunit Na+/H+ antiporter MnhC subunit